jgi:DNA-binding NarL/FixJ family response regulator
MSRIKVLIVDDQTLMREGLRTILSLEGDFVVTGAAEDGHVALDMAQECPPDVVLMDVRMPNMDGVTCTRELISRFPGIKVLILSTFAEDEAIYEGLKAGACGYLLKDLPSENLITAIREARAGVVSMQPEVMARLLAHAPEPREPKAHKLKEKLTAREWEIMQLMAQGLTNKEIAEKIFITEGTVKNYISTIYEKLGVKDRTQAVLMLKEV